MRLAAPKKIGRPRWESLPCGLQQWRAQGVGRALLQAAEAHFKASGVSTMRIELIAGNAGAAKAYEKFGFAPYSLALRKRF